VTTLGGGFRGPRSAVVDGSGNVYVADANNNAVKEMARATAPSVSFANTLANSGNSGDSAKTLTISNNGNAMLTFPLPSTGNNPSVAANFAWG
jgi:hypothetical protein